MNRPTTEPAFNPYTDEVEDLPPPTQPPIDDNPPDVLDASKNEEFEDLELTLSAHQQNHEPSYTEPFKEEYFSSSSEEKGVASWEQRRNAMRRKGVLGSVAVVLFIVIVAIAVASSLSKQNRSGPELSVSEAIGAPPEMTGTGAPSAPLSHLGAPVDSPVSVPVNAPVAEQMKAPVAEQMKAPVAEQTKAPAAEQVKAPVAAPVKAPVAVPVALEIKETVVPDANTTVAPVPVSVTAPIASPAASPVASPVSSPVSAPTGTHSVPIGHHCTTNLKTDKACYAQGETILVSFVTCRPGPYDWIGLYPEGSDTYGHLQPNFFYWEYTCGKTEGFCEKPPRTGTLSIPAKVATGSEYQMYMIAGKKPYMAMASTAPFLVTDECYDEDSAPQGEAVDVEEEKDVPEWMEDDEAGSN
jgi:hypothetical protein